MVRTRPVEPDLALTDAFVERYRRWREMYASLQSWTHLSHTLARVMRGGDGIQACASISTARSSTRERLQWQAYRRVLGEYGADVDLDEYRRRFIAVEGGAEWACAAGALPIGAADAAGPEGRGLPDADRGGRARRCPGRAPVSSGCAAAGGSPS